jgi:replicative DNA helicase
MAATTATTAAQHPTARVSTSVRGGHRRDDGVGVEQLLPQNREAEAGVLGSLLIDCSGMDQIASWLTPDDFLHESHRTIYQAMRDLYEAGEPADYITLSDALARQGVLAAIGGDSVLSALANHVPTSRHLLSYARIVHRTSLCRALIRAAGDIAGVAYSNPDADAALDAAYATLDQVALRRRNDQEAVLLGDALDETLEEIEQMARGDAQALMTGLALLDQHTGGFLPGELIMLAARPGVGKSALAAAVALAVARQCQRDGKGCVLWVTLEMNRRQVVKRLLSMLASLNTRYLRTGFRLPGGSGILQEAYDRIHQVADEQVRPLSQVLAIRDLPTGPQALDRLIARIAAQHDGCPLVIVDYLGLMQSDSGNPRESRYERVSVVSEHLKQMALAARVPVLCLVQLNRESEYRDNKRPHASELRDSGNLEQDADWILGLYRPVMFDEDRAKREPRFGQFAEVLVLKARDGQARAMIPLRYEDAYTRFSDWPHEWSYPDDASRPKGTMAVLHASAVRDSDDAEEE